MKYAVFSTSPWKWDWCVFHGGTPADFAAAVSKQLGAEVKPITDAQGQCYIEEGKPVMVWVEALSDIPTLSHELIHGVFGMLNARGLTHTRESEEAFCYTHEALLRAILANRKWLVCR